MSRSIAPPRIAVALVALVAGLGPSTGAFGVVVGERFAGERLIGPACPSYGAAHCGAGMSGAVTWVADEAPRMVADQSVEPQQGLRCDGRAETGPMQVHYKWTVLPIARGIPVGHAFYAWLTQIDFGRAAYSRPSLQILFCTRQA